MTSPKEVLAHYKSERESRVINMKLGSEMDALVAEKVMGYTREGVGWRMLNGNFTHHVRAHSDNIAAAWEVAEQLQKQGYVVCIELLPYEETSVGVYEADPANQIAYAKAQTPAEAICKAALLAVMDNETN